MLTKQDKLILEKFQRYSQEIEEDFAQMLAMNPNLRLKFKNINEAYTDGLNITVDPGMFEIFASSEIREKALNLLNWPLDTISTKEEVIYVLAHAQVIHECLHELYSEFPLPAYTDPLPTTYNQRKVLATIANIVEDSYIEAIGSTKFTNIRFYLQFLRTCVSVVKNEKPNTRVFKMNHQVKMLSSFMNYFISYILFPMDTIPTPPLEIQEYIRNTKPLFRTATMTGDPKARYRYVQQIFNIIKPLIPEDTEEIVDKHTFNNLIPGADTHNNNKAHPNNKSGKNQTPIAPLFPIVSNEKEIAEDEFEFRINPSNPTEEKLGFDLFDALFPPPQSEEFHEQMKEESQCDEYLAELKGFVEQIEEASDKQQKIIKEEQDSFQTPSIRISGDEFKDFTAHRNIRITENHPIPSKFLKNRYNDIYEELRSNIEYYNGCFLQMLQANRTVKESGYKYGFGISSRRLGDIKKRYWYRNVNEDDTPDLAVLILIDGSGSMSGEKRVNATKAAIILHEVLYKQGINHSIVEHRADCSTDDMEVNILIDFNGKPEQKYNLLRISAIDVNRDGLSLLWAERHISKQHNENKLIIVVSDGQPNHGSYTGDIAKKDTHDIALKIEKHNIGVIGIALENENSECYKDLVDIYPNLINCPSPKKLTRKLLEIIQKVI